MVNFKVFLLPHFCKERLRCFQSVLAGRLTGCFKQQSIECFFPTLNFYLVVCIILYSPAPVCCCRDAELMVLLFPHCFKICFVPGQWLILTHLWFPHLQKCVVRRVLVGVSAMWGLHPGKCIDGCLCNSKTFSILLLSCRPSCLRSQECSLVLGNILVHELVEEKEILF